MKVADLQPKSAIDEITVTVVEKGEVRDVKGGALKLCECQVKDDSGQTTLALWNADIDNVNKGDIVTIKKGWVNEYQGNMSISSGRFGTLEVTKGDGAAEAPAEVKEAYDDEII